MRGYAKMITLYAGLVVALVGAWVGMDHLGVRPAFNGEVGAAEARVAKQVVDLSKFSVGTRILTLQNERRYYERLMDQAVAAHQVSPSPAMVAAIRLHENTLVDIQRQIDGLRNK